MMQVCEYEQNVKSDLSSDYSLQLGSMKLESQVIADQQVAVNMLKDPAHTARHATGISFGSSGANILFSLVQFVIKLL